VAVLSSEKVGNHSNSLTGSFSMAVMACYYQCYGDGVDMGTCSIPIDISTG